MTLLDDVLTAAGLTATESAVYRVLIGSCPLTVAAIAREARIHRPLVYKALPSLLAKQLVSQTTKGKQKRYGAESPEALRELFAKREREFSAQLDDMTREYARSASQPIIRYFKGPAGLRHVMTDILLTLKKGDVFYRYSDRKASTVTEKYLPPIYKKMRDEKKLGRFVITNRAVEEAKKPSLDRAVKFIPREFDLFEDDVAEVIYAHKIAFFDYTSETACIIENAKLAEFQTKIFRLLYSKL